MRVSRRNLTSSEGSSSGANNNNNNKKKKLRECYSSSSSRVYKRTRTNQNVGGGGGEDIISHLPQDILHHIFTFLNTKQAIQTTCLLSRRWRYFWVSIPTLKFTFKGRCTKTIKNEFMDVVDRVLMIRGNSNIHEFVLVIDLDYIDVSDRLNAWILACVLRNVQQLTLHSYFPEKFHFHHCLLTCKSLTKLVVDSHVRRVSLSLPPGYSVTLPRLKTLTLDHVKFEDEDSANQLFSSCTVLESLTLCWCEFPSINVNISSPLLQHLVINHCTTKSNALDLKPVDNYMSTCCDLKNLCSLVEADLNVYIHNESKKKKAMYAPHMVNILRELHNVEDLTLSASFLEVISRDPDLFDRQPTKLCNLRCLKLEGEWQSIDYIHGISYLLKISPNIETLSIDVLGSNKIWEATADLLVMQHIQHCNLRCLKMHTFLSRDWINAIACILKICPNTETLCYTVYPDENCDYFSGNNLYCDKMNSDPTIERYFREAGLSLECLLNNLKCFELRDVTGRINELELLQILLKNAIVLKKLLIVFAGECHCVTLREKFSEKVLTFPRASPSVVILFKL